VSTESLDVDCSGALKQWPSNINIGISTLGLRDSKTVTIHDYEYYHDSIWSVF